MRLAALCGGERDEGGVLNCGIMSTKIQRIYLDTSVVGGYFDEEFEEDTRVLFDQIRAGTFHVVYSTVTEDELIGAPAKVRDLIPSLPQGTVTSIALTPEAVALADSYLRENVVGPTSRADCFHIALATLSDIDILVSWNFKHIVNVHRIRGYNSVNMKLGYGTLDIRSPKEVIYNDFKEIE